MLFRSPQELAALREHLRDPARLPLFDTARFVRHLEQAYLQMWERQQRGLPPQAFAVAECAGS